MAEYQSVNFPVDGMITRLQALTSYTALWKDARTVSFASLKIQVCLWPLRSIKQKELNFLTIMNVHLYLGNLLLIKHITLMKQECPPLYGHLTLLLSFGQNRLDKPSQVNEELWLPCLWSSILLVKLYHQFSSFQEHDAMTYWCLVHHLEAWV